MPDPNQEPIIELKLPLRLVNIIVASLAKQPLEAVLDAFVAVKQQTEQQLQAANAPQMAAPPNGKDATH